MIKKLLDNINNRFIKISEYIINKPPVFFILISILLHIIYLLLYNSIYNPGNLNILYMTLAGDSAEYMSSSEYLFKYGEFFVNGTYVFDKFVAVKDYTSRMPGMAFLYLPIRFFFSKLITMNLFIIVQTMLSAVSAYLLARIAEMIFQSKKIFLIVFIIYLLSPYVKYYNNILLTESLATSALIFSIYFLLNFNDNNKPVLLIWSGLFIMWCIFLRPFIFPVLFFYGIYIFIKTPNFKKKILYISIIILPFFIAESSWILRNYIITSKFVPFQTAGNPMNENKNCFNYKVKFLKSFGYDHQWWRKEYIAAWFNSDQTIKKFEMDRPFDKIIPKYIFTEKLTIDTLKYARYCVWQSINDSLDNKTRKQYNDKACDIFQKFIDSHSFYTTQVLSRVKFLFRFLNQPTTEVLKYTFFPLNVILIFTEVVINYFVLFIGFFGLLLILSSYRKNIAQTLFVYSIPGFIIAFFPLLFRISELREITLAYPFLCISAVYLFYYLYSKFRLKILFISILIFSILAANISVKTFGLWYFLTKIGYW